MKRSLIRLCGLWLIMLAISGAVGVAASPISGIREGVPIVLTGELLPWENVSPNDVVAFSYHDGWTQIPVQVDERDQREYIQIYGPSASENPITAVYGTGIHGIVYCDPNTFTGPDSDPTLDVNDEIVFMAHDAGNRAPTDEGPSSVREGSGIELELADPLTDQVSYMYLFLQDGSLDPSTGMSYVEYDFNPLSGEYKTTYNTAGMDMATGLLNDDFGEQLNPEDSMIRTSMYERHWSYRWTCDSLSLSGGPNLVEREDYWMAPGACLRHIGTFNAQEGCFIANISGPVRAIRSYLGANSGPLVQVDKIYYETREDSTIYLRVHPRPAVGTFYVDHTLAAIGMTYHNDLNLDGVTIDGHSDHLTLGPITWELVTGEPGSVLRIHDIDTDIPFTDEDFTVFYADALDTDIRLCLACLEGCEESVPLGDPHLIGASGVWNTAQLPNTDPGLLATKHLTMLITTYYGDQDWMTTDAILRRAWSDYPLEIGVVPWPTSAE
ncbi:hypothetical protein KAT84_03870 [Candidatus Bipolaricaulota bacterium]|nr:hypothetical protein [Candidatus Bipolaricaulota bacterium]